MTNFVMLSLPVAAAANSDFVRLGKGCCHNVPNWCLDGPCPTLKLFDGPWDGDDNFCQDKCLSYPDCRYVTEFSELPGKHGRWCTVLSNEVDRKDNDHSCAKLDHEGTQDECGPGSVGDEGVYTYFYAGLDGKDVTISYMLDDKVTTTEASILADSQDSCTPEFYRLIFDKQVLQLVGVHKDPTTERIVACDPDIPNQAIDDGFWRFSKGGIFSPNQDPDKNFCLATEPFTNLLITNPDVCTDSNTMSLTEGWQFNQGPTLNLCMPEVNVNLDDPTDPNKRQWIVPSEKLTADVTSCGHSWKMEVFKPQSHLQSEMSQQTWTCDECRIKDGEATVDGVGNFACRTDTGCRMAPNEAACLDLPGGQEWCSKPVHNYPVCRDQHGWKPNSERRICSAGCSYNMCEQKQPGLAEWHCYTDLSKQKQGYLPDGCNYGSDENTCAYDDAGDCVYSDLSSSMTV